MSRYIAKLAAAATACLMIIAISCTKDAEVVEDNYDPTSTNPVVSAEMKSALSKLGYSFTSDDRLISNELVLSTTSLDLSSCQLIDVIGLISFEALKTVNLSSNNFGTELDFDNLPTSVETINLTYNDEIRSYLNLVSASDGAVRLSKLSTLQLPNSAWSYFTDVIAFAQSSVGKSASISYIADDGKTLATYTTTRTITNAELKTALMSLYPSAFNALGEIELLQQIEESVDLELTTSNSSLAGVEYIICNPSYAGATGGVSIVGDESNPCEITWMKPSSKITSLTLINVDTPNEMVLTSSPNLSLLRVENNPSIVTIDLPSSLLQSSVSGTSIFKSELYVKNCAILQQINFPSSGGYIGKIDLQSLPLLQSLSLLNVKGLHTFVLNDLSSTALALPTSVGGYPDGWGGSSSKKRLFIAMDSNMTGKCASLISLYNDGVVDMSEPYKITQ